MPKGKSKENIPGIDDKDNKEPYKAKINTEYVIRGDGQFVLKIMSPADRDKEKARLAREHAKKLKEQAKAEDESTTKAAKTETAANTVKKTPEAPANSPDKTPEAPTNTLDHSADDSNDSVN